MCRGKRSGKCGGSSVRSGEWGCGGSRVGRVESEAWRERVEEQNGEYVGCSGNIVPGTRVGVLAGQNARTEG